jgi:phosphopentomutase
MAQKSSGKDSTTGHWEIAGLIVEKEFPTYPQGFPPAVMSHFLEVAGCAGYLGNVPASGTAIIERFGDEHVATGFPIIYTSGDSVFQIAAHEEVIPLVRLYEICRRTREEVCVGEHTVGRVIARPFVGAPGAYARTTNRRDFSVLPGGPTMLDVLSDAGVATTSIGKVDDLFARRGIAAMHHSKTNEEGIEFLLRESGKAADGLIFANLVDFDMLYGHRNDPQGFARALEQFDRALPALMKTIGAGEMLILTADHGNDPTSSSSDHSREYVPLLVYAPENAGRALGVRATFADLGKTIAEYFGVRNSLSGTSFLKAVMG